MDLNSIKIPLIFKTKNTKWRAGFYSICDIWYVIYEINIM